MPLESANTSNLSNEIENFLKTLKIHNKDLDACFNDAVASHHLTTLLNKQIVASKIEELSHVQLEYGGRFVATTYADGDGQSITARIEDLKEELE